MEERVICSLRFIIADDSIFGFRFEDFQIIKGGSELDADIFTLNLVEQAGLLSIKEFINYPFFFFNCEGSEDELIVRTGKYHTRLNQFLNFLWFSKDNSVNVGNLYCYLPGTNKLIANAKLASYSDSAGKHQSVEITQQDFDIALNAFNRFVSISSDDRNVQMPKVEYPVDRPVITDSTYHYADYNKNTRIERAFSFLTMARTSSFLPLKISLFMSLLECLFTTDRQEVTHKVCERVALYLGGTYQEKKDNYKIIKEAYDIRSGFFHGQEIDKKQDTRENLTIHSQRVDSILRTILTKVLFDDADTFNNTKEIRVEFFNKMVLG